LTHDNAPILQILKKSTANSIFSLKPCQEQTARFTREIKPTIKTMITHLKHDFS